MGTHRVTFIWRGAVHIDRDPTYEVFEVLHSEDLLSDLRLSMSDYDPHPGMEEELSEQALIRDTPNGVYIVLLMGFIDCWDGHDHEGTPDGSTELHINHSHWEPASKDDIRWLMDQDPSLDLKEFL